MKYTEEEKKQLKAAFCRMLDNEECFISMDIMEVEKEGSIEPKVARKRFRVSLTKEGNVEKR